MALLRHWKRLILISGLGAAAFGGVSAQTLLPESQEFVQTTFSAPKGAVILAEVAKQTGEGDPQDKAGEASVQTDEEAKLRPYLERIDTLEDRVRRLEALLSASMSQPPSEATHDTVPRSSAPPPDYVATSASGPGTGPDYSGQPGDNAAPAPGAIQNETDREEYKQLLLVREHAVTLRKGDTEVSGGAFYLRDNNFSQKDVAFQANASVRYGLARGTEIAAAFTGFWSRRNTQVFSNIIENDLSDFGSADFQINKAVIKEGIRIPGIVLSISGSLPLGDNPYSSTTERGKIPTDPFVFDMVPGHYLLRGNVQFFKSFDPISYYWGVGVEYAFPETIAGVEIEPGVRYSYNAGLGFAVNETTALGVGISGYHQDLLIVGGVPVNGFVEDPVSLRMSVSHVLGNNFHLVPGVTVGLTAESPDVVVGLEVRKVFSAKP